MNDVTVKARSMGEMFVNMRTLLLRRMKHRVFLAVHKLVPFATEVKKSSGVANLI